MAVNLLSNPSLEDDLTDWASSQGSLAIVTANPKNGAKAARFVANGTGNRNITHTPVPVGAETVFSADVYARHVSGTPRQAFVMCQMLNASGGQVVNWISQLVLLPSNGEWTRLVVENAQTFGAVSVRVQVRMGQAAVGDTMDFDDAWLNAGPTLDRTQPAPSLTVWDGAAEKIVAGLEVVNANGTTSPVTLG